MTGYVDTPYADTFFRELSPAWLHYVAALNGVASCPIGEPFNYLELGCGFGTSAVVNAAAFPQGTFHACDFNDAHIDAGRGHAMRLGVANIEFHARPFADLPTLDLPRFDFIVMHGVYSWVDGPTRAVLRESIHRLLLPGGLLYVSYNTLPGWSVELPLRKLLVELAASEEGNAAEQSERAVATVQALSTAGLRYFTATPAASAAVDAYTRGEGRYLAHEFMNAAWEPFYAVDVADEFATIGLLPVGSATLSHNHLPLLLEAKAAQAIAGLATPRQQQLAIDFATNQRFRRDVFVRADGTSTHGHAIDGVVVGCALDVEEIGSVARVPRGEIRFQDAFVEDVRALMAAGSYPFADAVAAVGRRGHDRAGIARNLLFLIAGGALAPFARALRVGTNPPTRLASPMVERALADAARAAGRRAVPSGVYGNGLELDPAEARIIQEWAAGHAVPAAFVDRRLPTLSRLGLVV